MNTSIDASAFVYVGVVSVVARRRLPLPMINFASYLQARQESPYHPILTNFGLNRGNSGCVVRAGRKTVLYLLYAATVNYLCQRPYTL